MSGKKRKKYPPLKEGEDTVAFVWPEQTGITVNERNYYEDDGQRLVDWLQGAVTHVAETYRIRNALDDKKVKP